MSLKNSKNMISDYFRTKLSCVISIVSKVSMFIASLSIILIKNLLDGSLTLLEALSLMANILFRNTSLKIKSQYANICS